MRLNARSDQGYQLRIKVISIMKVKFQVRIVSQAESEILIDLTGVKTRVKSELYGQPKWG